MIASPKSVAKEQAKNAHPFYELRVEFSPDGLQIKQNSDKVSAFDVIGVLDIVKGLHSGFFQKQLSNPDVPKLSPEAVEEMRKHLEGLNKSVETKEESKE